MDVSVVVDKLISDGKIDEALHLLSLNIDEDKSILGLLIEKFISSDDCLSLLKCFEKTGEEPEEEEIGFLLGHFFIFSDNNDYLSGERIENLLKRRLFTEGDLKRILENNLKAKINLKVIFKIFQRIEEIKKDNETKKSDGEKRKKKKKEEGDCFLQEKAREVIDSYFGDKLMLKFFRFLPDRSVIKNDLNKKLSEAIKEGDFDKAKDISYFLERKLSRSELELILETAIETDSCVTIEKVLKILKRKLTQEELKKRFLYLVKNNEKDKALNILYLFVDKNKPKMTKIFIERFGYDKKIPD